MRSSTAALTTIDQYIDGFPENVRILLSQMRATISESAPDATEKISYRIPTFYYNGNLVHFAAFKHHIGFYPTSSGIAAFKEELKNYKSAKGSVQFPMEEPLPLKLVAEIVKFRVRENSTKGAKLIRQTRSKYEKETKMDIKKQKKQQVMKASIADSTVDVKNFRARVVFKSGASQEFLIVAGSTDAFTIMRNAFLSYLNAGSPKSGQYVIYKGSVVIVWTDVSSFYEWTD